MWSRNKDPKFCDRRFDDPTRMDLKGTLGQKLIPVVDNVRNLFTKFGLRPYKIRIVRVKWSGGRRGRGVPHIARQEDLLPTPLVDDLNALTEVLEPIGMDETGTIVVSEISGRFTDDQLRYLDDDGEQPGPDEEIFYEIEYPQPDGSGGDVMRRFTLRGAPHYDANRFQWSVRLERAQEDRTRQGDPR